MTKLSRSISAAAINKEEKKVEEIKKLKKAKFVYAFGKRTDGDAAMREILGGKGANLAEMALIGLPVPPGFTLSTEVCGYFYGNSGNYPKGLENAVSKAILEVEKQQNKGFGDPLLVKLLIPRIHDLQDIRSQYQKKIQEKKLKDISKKKNITPSFL